MAVSSMDAATAFGGMGGSREVYVAAFVEPVVMLAVLSNVLHTNSTSLAGMSLRTDEVNLDGSRRADLHCLLPGAARRKQPYPG